MDYFPWAALIVYLKINSNIPETIVLKSKPLYKSLLTAWVR